MKNNKRDESEDDDAKGGWNIMEYQGISSQMLFASHSRGRNDKSKET
jgi:hypothetical protein